MPKVLRQGVNQDFDNHALQGYTLSAGYQESSGDSDLAQLDQSGLAGKGAGGASVYLITEAS